MAGLMSPKHCIPVRVGALPPMSNEEFVDSIIESGYLKTKRIIDAFRKVDRAYFVSKNRKHQAYDDIALGIGYGATISQPSTVAFLLERLQPKKGNKILEIGSGSGYVTALLSVLVGKKGKVFALDYILELVDLAEKNLLKFGKTVGQVKFFTADGKLGLPIEAPFDKILSSAQAKEIPRVWKEQLKKGGRIVTPFDTSIVVVDKIREDDYKLREYPGFVFVPLK